MYIIYNFRKNYIFLFLELNGLLHDPLRRIFPLHGLPTHHHCDLRALRELHPVPPLLGLQQYHHKQSQHITPRLF